MLGNLELLTALETAGVDSEKAEAAAAVIAKLEGRLLRLEATMKALKFVALIGALLLLVFLLYLPKFSDLRTCLNLGLANDLPIGRG